MCLSRVLALGCILLTDLSGLLLIMFALHIHSYQCLYMTLLLCCLYSMREPFFFHIYVGLYLISPNIQSGCYNFCFIRWFALGIWYLSWFITSTYMYIESTICVSKYYMYISYRVTNCFSHPDCSHELYGIIVPIKT